MKDIPLLKLKNVSKFYYNKGVVASGFSKVSLEFNLGEFVVITGESGSGKSTLLNVLSGLDSYEEGEMYINGKETSHYSEEDFENYRKTYIGNIFQSFNLVGSYTVYQNIELVLLLNGYSKRNIKSKIIELIKKVDLYKYRNTKVSRLSGGQKQRVAIARALAKETPIIIADEPTGNLDSKSAKSVIKLLSEIAKDKLVVIVTHNYDQVEEYATRKIEMHDGKVREDIDLKAYKSKEPELKEYDNITFFNKIRIGVRNTFNIVPKFVLTFIVFLFVVVAFLGEYSGFRQAEYEEKKGGYSDYFQNVDDKRIVIKKKDKSYFTDNDYESIKKIENVDYIVKDDAILDTEYLVVSGNYNFYGNIAGNNKITKVDIGRLPKEDNEIVIQGPKYDYYLGQMANEILDSSFELQTIFDTKIKDNLKVVGIIYNDDYSGYIHRFYVADAILKEIRTSTNEQYSKMIVTINDKKYEIGQYDAYMRITPNKAVQKGEAIMSYDLNYLCKYDWCGNSVIKVDVENLYYKDSKELKVTHLYTKYTFKNLLEGVYDEYNPRIYISEEDYNDLYNKEPYQSSIFVKDVKKIYDAQKAINSKGYSTLVIKDTLNNESAEVLKVINIFKIILTTVLFVVLFFIAYFVIRLIQKSKNVYYSTVRILGGSKRVIRDFISIELLTDFNMAFLITVFFVILNKNNIIKSNFISDITSYLTLKDFIIIYIILTVMSYFISLRYARKLFKSSAMKTYNEEV